MKAQILNLVKTALASFSLLIILIISLYLGNATTPPAYQYHETTWLGQPAMGKLHENGTYSFYNKIPFYSTAYVGQHIITMPIGDAIHLH